MTYRLGTYELEEPYQQISREVGAAKGLCGSHLWGWLQGRQEKQGFTLCLACLTFVGGTSGLGQMPLYFLCALWSSWPPASYPSVLCSLGRQQVSCMLRSPSLEPQFTPVASHGDSCLVELDLPFGK